MNAKLFQIFRGQSEFEQTLNHYRLSAEEIELIFITFKGCNDGMCVASAHWLNDILSEQKMFPPRNPLHFPVAFKEPPEWCQALVSLSPFIFWVKGRRPKCMILMMYKLKGLCISCYQFFTNHCSFYLWGYFLLSL